MGYKCGNNCNEQHELRKLIYIKLQLVHKKSLPWSRKAFQKDDITG